MLEFVQVKVHLSLIRQKDAVYASLCGIEVVDPGLLLYPIETRLQWAEVIFENGGEGFFAKGLVDGEFDE